MLLDFSRRRFAIPETRNARHVWVEREAVFLAVTCPKTGVRGFGEASPLPGYSVDDVATVESWLTAHQLEISSFDAALTWLDPESTATPPALQGAPPAARCAVEAALLDGYCRSRNVSPRDALRSLLGPSVHLVGTAQSPPSTKLVSATLLDVYGDDLAGRACAFSDAGYRTFKVKVGRDLAFETRALTSLTEQFAHVGRPLTLRLDANRSLPGAQLHELGRAWRHLPIEYVEEPCTTAELRGLDPAAPLGFALAFDESLASGLEPLKPWLTQGQVRALVCKPMYLGGASAAVSWARVAREYAVQLVLSHLFDGPGALDHYRDLAQALAPDVIAGLAPHDALPGFVSAEQAWRQERGYQLRELPELSTSLTTEGRS